MNRSEIEQLRPLFDTLERCHTVLADVFPHQGLKAAGGSRIFLRDPLLGVLKDCAKQIMKELKKSAASKLRNDVAALWAEVEELLVRIDGQDLDGRNDTEINKAASLLYFANGLTWNCLREFASDEPPHNPQYVKIEPLVALLRLCGWESGENVTSKQIAERLRAELKVCLR